jgi:hypothetical protein
MTISTCNTEKFTGIAIYCTQSREMFIAALQIYVTVSLIVSIIISWINHAFTRLNGAVWLIVSDKNPNYTSACLCQTYN